METKTTDIETIYSEGDIGFQLPLLAFGSDSKTGGIWKGLQWNTWKASEMLQLEVGLGKMDVG